MLLAAIGFSLYHKDQMLALNLPQLIHDLGWAGPAIFIGVYALATLFFLPGVLLTLAGGAMFGLGWGTFYNLTGATLGAALSFLASRWLLGDFVEKKAKGRLGYLRAGVEQQGWSFIAFVRLVPFFPFNLLNYALGLTGIPFITYLWVSYLTMLPGALVYTYLGVVSSQVLEAENSWAQLGPKALLGLGLIALLVYLPRLYLQRKNRKIPHLKPQELTTRLKEEGFLLIDLRDASLFQQEGFISGAINIPLEKLKNRIGTSAPSLNQPIGLTCTTTLKSYQAWASLTQWGYTQVFVIQGGMTLWRQLGLPLTYPKAT